jgi:hypothetical protein
MQPYFVAYSIIEMMQPYFVLDRRRKCMHMARGAMHPRLRQAMNN